MQEGRPNIKDVSDFLRKIKNVNANQENVIQITADVVGLYSSIPNQSGQEAFRKTLDKRKTNKVLTGKLVKMTGFVLKNNYFHFSDKVYQQVSGTAKSTKFTTPYPDIFIGPSVKEVPTKPKVSTSCMVQLY